MAKERPDSLVMGLDNCYNAIAVAQKNSNHLNVLNNSFLEMDILNSSPQGIFDLVISNPPYISKKELSGLMKDVIDFEPKIALTDYKDGLSFYKRFAKIIPKIVNKSSFLIFEVGLNNHPQKVHDIFSNSGYRSIEIIKDLSLIHI